MQPPLILTRVGEVIYAAPPGGDAAPAADERIHEEQPPPGAGSQGPGGKGDIFLMPIAEGMALAAAIGMAGYAIAKIASTAIEAAARQPEAAGKMQTMMILSIAFLEALVLLTIIFAGLPLIMGR